MIIDTEEFSSMPNLKRATLTQAADGPAELALEWHGFGPDWVQYREPITLIHRGAVLFHGLITRYEQSNDAGLTGCTAAAHDALWLLDHLTLGAQVAEVRAANEGKSVDWRGAACEALGSWQQLADSCNIAAPGWVVDELGEPREDASLWLDTSRSRLGAGVAYKKDKPVTAWTALLEMKQLNPDAYYKFSPTTGAVEVIAVSNAAEEVWSTEEMDILSISGVTPQYEQSITGVALVVSWGGGGMGGSKVMTYPPSVTVEDMGVKIFSATVENPEQAEVQARHMMRQIADYYDAVNILQWGGVITARMESVAESPLCKRLSIVGEGTHPSWGDMRTMCSAVAWNFTERTVEVTLGVQFEEPSIDEIEFESVTSDETEEPLSSSTSTQTASGGGHYPPPSSSSTTTWDYEGKETTEEEDETTATWDETLTDWDYTTTWRDTTTDEGTDGTTTESDTHTYTQSTTEGSETTSGSGNSESQEVTLSDWVTGCDCDEDRKNIWDKLRELEERLNEIKQCDCCSTTDDLRTEMACMCERIWESQKAFNALIHSYNWGTYFGTYKLLLKDKECLPDWYNINLKCDDVVDKVMDRIEG